MIGSRLAGLVLLPGVMALACRPSPVIHSAPERVVPFAISTLAPPADWAVEGEFVGEARVRPARVDLVVTRAAIRKHLEGGQLGRLWAGLTPRGARYLDPELLSRPVDIRRLRREGERVLDTLRLSIPRPRVGGLEGYFLVFVLESEEVPSRGMRGPDVGVSYAAGPRDLFAGIR